ncbi:MAG: hypothetical protein ABIR80_16850 [Opitutaceae bacterium]
MKRADQDRLLTGILEDEKLAALRRSSLAGMLAASRARGRRRTAVRAAASVTVLCSLVFLASRRSEIILPTGPVIAPTVSRVKFIDDEQLLALFPGRSVALIGPPGNQKLLFLDGTAGVVVSESARR